MLSSELATKKAPTASAPSPAVSPILKQRALAKQARAHTLKPRFVRTSVAVYVGFAR